MTVLRSRKVSPTVSPKSSVENEVVEPMTPLKTGESVNRLSNSVATPSPNSSARGYKPPESGVRSGKVSSKVVEAGTLPRRSSRFATKLGVSECLESVEAVSRKRKKIVSEVESNSSNPREVQKTSMMVCNLGDGNVNQLVKDESIENGGSAVKLGLDSDMEVDVETVNDGKKNRRFSGESKILCSESCEKDGLEKGILNLRSGKRIIKKEIEVESGLTGSWSQRLESSPESEITSIPTKNGSEASMEENRNCGSRKTRFSRADKGKSEVGCESLVMSDSALQLGDSNSNASDLLIVSDSKEVIEDKISVKIGSVTKARRRLSKEEKGKMKLGDKDSAYSGTNQQEVNVEDINGTDVFDSIDPASSAELLDGVQAIETDVLPNDARRVHRERFRSIARRIASRFAHFSPEDELGNRAPDVSGREIPVPVVNSAKEDWPGPFSTAMKIVQDRKTNKNVEGLVTSTDTSEAAELKWIPTKQEQFKHPKQLVPSLQELCLSVLAKNADAISSLDCVPDPLRHKICWFLCDHRKMNSHFFELLVHGSPTEIRVRDCSWLTEELFVKTLEGCNTSKLMVLQLDQGGACIPDYTLPATVARSPGSLPALTTISLKGAYRLTDAGLRMLVSSAPHLKSLDVSQCSLLTSDGLSYLANSLRSVLRELYIDNCHDIDAMRSLPALLELEKLEVFSVSGVQTVSDDFVSKIVSVHGCRIKEIALADCMELTDLSLEAIGNSCYGLRALDLSNLCKLTDIGICHLANGCREIQILKLCRSALSDEAIAAYLDIRGACLKELSLNNITKVSNYTALSLARNCRNLQTLDVSWCRSLTDEALGLTVDTCSSLELLKMFGCTQVTNAFLDGHSNQRVKIIGLKMTPIFKHIRVPDFLEGPLRYSSTFP